MKQVLLVLALTLTTNIAYAAFTDGNELYQWLLEDENENGSRFKSGLYSGYVNGVVDLGDDILFCTTTGVTRGQFTAVVAKYLKNNPEKWNQSAHSIVVDAMEEAFPCKK
ncbi:Rap1a/Tai family immunity protein [Spongiibacter tropicus]|uniref:Rap1a/Tai family immunity protein n=1 Tax=Spongiibacter tropicus TaxID=454602 RepID=UPI003A99B34F